MFLFVFFVFFVCLFFWGGVPLTWHWHFLISSCSQNDFAQNVWRYLIKSHTTSSVHYSGSFLICWPAYAIIIVTDAHPGAKQVPEHQQQPCWLYFTDRVTQTYYIRCIHHQTEREARGPLTYHFLCYPWVRFLNAIDNIINNAAQITIQWVVASLLPRLGGAFDLRLAVSVPLPIVMGIFVLLWFQSRLT